MTTTARKRVLRLLIATLKGGSAKTTTAVLLALALGRKGYKVVGICADTRSQGLSDWRNLMTERGIEVPITMITWRGEDEDGKLSRFASKAEREHDADVVIIDTGGEHPDVFMSAALYADRLISPVGAMIAELRRLPATEDAAAEINEGGHEIVMSVLLNRVPSIGKGAAREARSFIDGTDLRGGDEDAYDMHVLQAEIPRDASKYADVWGTDPDDLAMYKVLADEIEQDWRNAA